jgi:hypothetical protein
MTRRGVDAATGKPKSKISNPNKIQNHQSSSGKATTKRFNVEYEEADFQK